MEIIILDFRFTKGRRATLAFCDLQMGEITIKDFRIYQTNGKPSVRNPFTAYKDFEGNLTFREIINLPPKVQTEAHALILGEYFRRLKEKNDERQQK
jgi:hypothetical protein